MKTETEKLRESAEAQYRKERIDELNEYIEGLFVKLRKIRVKMGRINIFELLTLATWVIVLITYGDGVIATTIWAVWLISWLYELFVYRDKAMELVGNIEGAFETLRILGFMSRDDETGRKRKLRKLRDNPIARLWAQIKKKKQEEVYV